MAEKEYDFCIYHEINKTLPSFNLVCWSEWQQGIEWQSPRNVVEVVVAVEVGQHVKMPR